MCIPTFRRSVYVVVHYEDDRLAATMKSMQHLAKGNVTLLRRRQVADERIASCDSSRRTQRTMCVISNEKQGSKSSISSVALCVTGADVERRTSLRLSRLYRRAATTITTRPKKSSATFTPCCTRRSIARATPNSCASIFRACPFPSRRTISNGFQSSAGHWCRRICCASCRAGTWHVPRQGRSRGGSRALFPQEQAVWINKTQFFKPVTAGRVGLPHRRLSGARQVPEVAQGAEALAWTKSITSARSPTSLAFTIDQMAKID